MIGPASDDASGAAAALASIFAFGCCDSYDDRNRTYVFMKLLKKLFRL